MRAVLCSNLATEKPMLYIFYKKLYFLSKERLICSVSTNIDNTAYEIKIELPTVVAKILVRRYLGV